MHGSDRNVFECKEMMNNLTQTHTTDVLLKMLYKFASQLGGFTLTKYDSIERLFQKESIFATHLCKISSGDSSWFRIQSVEGTTYGRVRKSKL